MPVGTGFCASAVRTDAAVVMIGTELTVSSRVKMFMLKNCAEGHTGGIGRASSPGIRLDTYARSCHSRINQIIAECRRVAKSMIAEELLLP
jgi:hypothetical protein